MHLFRQERPCIRSLGIVIERQFPIDLDSGVVSGRYDFTGVRLGLGVVFGRHVMIVLSVEDH